MIRSCDFSFDENSVWDTKAIREHLIISEDQLNKLRNIPEWTKEKDNYYSRINSCVISQVERNPSNTFLRNQEVINGNIELFDKNFGSRENIIQAYKLKALKFSKSISLFEIDKISANSPCGNHLSPALSLPNLSLFSKDFSTQCEVKSFCEKSDLLTRLNSGVLNTGNSQTSIENPNMEVVIQLPAVVPQIVKNNENFAIVDKTNLSASQTIQSSDNSSNSCNLTSTFVDCNRSDDLTVATKIGNLVEVDEINSVDKSVTSNENKQIIVGNNNLDIHENTTKLAEPIDLNLLESKETDSSIAKEFTDNNCIDNISEEKRSELEGNINQNNELQVIVEESVVNNSLNADKNFKHVVEDCTLNNSETSVENLKELSVVPQLCESKITPVSSDELKSKLTDNSHDSKMNVLVACQGAGDGQVATSQNIPLKRKSESKGRSSKRSKGSREKQGCPNERSIKKAGDIHYCAEDIKIMFDLLKLFY